MAILANTYENSGKVAGWRLTVERDFMLQLRAFFVHLVLARLYHTFTLDFVYLVQILFYTFFFGSDLVQPHFDHTFILYFIIISGYILSTSYV